MRMSAFVGPVVAVLVLAYRAVIRAEMRSRTEHSCQILVGACRMAGTLLQHRSCILLSIFGSVW
jgi:hypothetical protein